MKAPARKPGEGVHVADCPVLYRERARRGAQSAKARISVWMVEGESVTYAQMSARLNCSVDAVKSRFEQARRMGRPITWQELSR